ncbi:MAG TPA: hypothetical protein EYQ31_12185, partial [Candidatus Handelsmanbacteria bacterium]|nr:hypothetical protein [Candidatus Handelsmanbacteria bacterium]
RVKKAQEVSDEQARELVEQHDRWRQLYLRNYHDADWDDLLLYHLTINTGRVEPEEAVDLMVRYVTQKGS